MVLWIYIEVVLLQAYSFLHTIYIGTGIAQLALTLAYLGLLRRDARLAVRSRAGVRRS